VVNKLCIRLDPVLKQVVSKPRRPNIGSISNALRTVTNAAKATSRNTTPSVKSLVASSQIDDYSITLRFIPRFNKVLGLYVI
jgi:hypothetical protein